MATAALLFCAGGLQMRENAAVVAALDQAYPCRELDTETRILEMKGRCEATRDVGEGPVRIRFNGDGFRGRSAERKTVQRIGLLGGSTSVGPGLTDEERPAAQLQEALGDDVEVIDLSVEGYTTIHHLIRLDEYADRFHLDVVLFDTLSRQKVFRDRVLMEYVVYSDVDGRPLRLLTPRAAWGGLVDFFISDDLHPLARTTLESFRHQRLSRRYADDPEQLLHDVAPLYENARVLAEKRELRLFFVWDKSDITNDRMVGVNEVRAQADRMSRWTPSFSIPGDEAHAVLKTYDIPMVGLTEPDAALRFSGSIYYRPEGARKRMFSLAKNLQKKLDE